MLSVMSLFLPSPGLLLWVRIRRAEFQLRDTMEEGRLGESPGPPTISREGPWKSVGMWGALGEFPVTSAPRSAGDTAVAEAQMSQDWSKDWARKGTMGWDQSNSATSR